MDREQLGQNMKTNVKRQIKNIVRVQDNLINAIAYFVVGALLLVAGAFTGLPVCGLVGGGCIILGLERLVRRSAQKNGDVVSDLRYKETNREDQLRK